jgi:hypothetical protein
MYGGLPKGRGSLPPAARACGAAAFAVPALQSSISKASSSLERTRTRPTQLSGYRIANTARPYRSKRCVRCARPVPACAPPPHRSSPRCEGLPRVNTIKSQFCRTGTSAGVEPATRGYQAAALPSELTCGGMKQSDRAVRACATRSGAQAGQVGLRTHCRCTIDVSTSSRDPGNPRSQILHLVLTNDFLIVQNDETPVGSAFRGLMKRYSGDCHVVSPAT